MTTYTIKPIEWDNCEIDADAPTRGSGWRYTPYVCGYGLNTYRLGYVDEDRPKALFWVLLDDYENMVGRYHPCESVEAGKAACEAHNVAQVEKHLNKVENP